MEREDSGEGFFDWLLNSIYGPPKRKKKKKPPKEREVERENTGKQFANLVNK